MCGPCLDFFCVCDRFEKKRMLIMNIFDSGLCYVIKYGDEMRAWIDVGFSTAENH